MSSPTRRRVWERHDHPRTDHSLDIKLFSPELLKTDQGVQNALAILDRSWWHKDQMELTVEELMAGPANLFEYTVAIALDECRYNHLLDTLKHTFPSTADAFPTSLAAKLVARLRKFYILLVSPEVPRSLDERHRYVPLALGVFDALRDLKFAAEPSTLQNPLNEIDGIKCKRPQQKAKHVKNQSRAKISTDTPFSAMGKQVPQTEQEASEVATQILHQLENVLEEYLKVLKIPELAQTIQDIYIHPNNSYISNHVAPAPQSEPTSDVTVLELEIPPAFPQIQPLKAAKYFSEPAEGFGPWNILLSSRAIQHLKNYHRDQAVWSIIREKLQHLSIGFFSKSNQKKLLGNDQDVPIFEAKLTRDLRIIYQIDIAPDDATRNDHQVIKVWGIHTHAQMDKRLWNAISKHQNRIGKEYRSRCLFRQTPVRPGNNIIYPHSWPTAVAKLPAESAGDTSMSAEEQLELHSILALEKFTRMSQALLNSIIANQDVAYPFELTGPEQEICDYPSSCFVLGRSGTGKTTTMVSKMIAREMLRIQQASDPTDASCVSRCRQLFVTQSRILAGRVQEYFGKMMMSHSVGQKSSQELEHLAQRNQRARDGEGMFDLDEDEDERADLPKRFSDLEDAHFPLFLTMNQLCKLLEADYHLSFKRRPRTREHHRAEQRSEYVEVERDMLLDDDDLAKDDDIVAASPSLDALAATASIITFDIFLYAYWPRLPQPLTKGLDPALVYNEFMGVLKGSEESLETGNETNFLDKQTYLNFSLRKQPTFLNHRSRVYQLFEHYIKLKRERGDYDVADRTHAILRALRGNLPVERKVDFLYVDEAQDNLIVDAYLLRLLCSNVHGLFFAGDTAQTISMGSCFRFDDLKSFLYRIEQKSSRSPVHPESFQLDINYRSHAGVVNCAHSIVELITEFWPDTIDTLARERGLVEGPRPVFFSGWDTEAARFEQFLFHESGNIEFGAQQCILVRNDQARDELRREIGEVGLVMTLYESKGLEFNDVLLFNFFSDSTVALADWRVILNAVEEAKRGHVPAPRFDETRHSSLCSELKQLYVGITRARSHIWILDNSEKGEPMRMFWDSRKLLQMCRPGDTVPALAVRSTSEQWAQQGHVLFKTKHFQQAMFCFEHAELQFERFVAYAHLLRRAAQRTALRDGQRITKNEAYLRAAESFVVCAGLSSPEMRSRYFGIAADCFSLAGRSHAAAAAYHSAEKFTQALEHFKRACLFDAAADVILLHSGKVDPKVAARCLSIAKLHFHREGQLQKANRLFESLDDHLQYLGDYGFHDAHTRLLEDHGRWTDAAELHCAEGRYLDAIRLWLRAGDPASTRRAGSCLLDSVWETLPLGSQPNTSDPHQENLLELLHRLGAELLEPAQRDESAMFIAILAGDSRQLLHMAREFHRIKANPMAALLCFDHALSTTPPMQNDNAQAVSNQLEDYDSYVQLMRRVIFGREQTLAATLLGFIKTSGESATGALQELHVLPTSILYKNLRDGDAGIQRAGERIVVNMRNLSGAIREVLGQRLAERIVMQNQVCLRIKAFRLCLNMAVTDQCGRGDCHGDHISRKSLDVQTFNLRVRLHMQQILIVHSMNVLPHHNQRRQMHRVWQERLYETLFPTFYSLGHISGLVKALIPESQRTLLVLSDWIRDRLYSLDPYGPYRRGAEDLFLTDVVQTTMLAFALDRTRAVDYTRRANCVALSRPPYLLRKDGYVVHDLLDFLEASSKTSVASGVLFIKHVLDHRLAIDLNMLLTVLEAVVARAIIAYRPLNQLTLPRSWIVNVLANDERCRNIESVRIVRILFEPLKALLENICTNQDVDKFVYERRPLSIIPSHSLKRSILIFRVCKCLTLFGYNINHVKLRDEIGKILTSINKPGRIFSPLVVQYVKAARWADLARAVRASTDSRLDEMVLLGRNDKFPNIYRPPVGQKLVRFNFESDILPALAYVPASNFNPEAKPFVPAAAQRTGSPVPDAETLEDELVLDESFNDETKDIEVAPNDISIQRTQAEVNAVSVIQSWYRRRLAIPSKTATSEITSQMHANCRAEVDKLQISPCYRRMFLGPLPHVLTALLSCKSGILQAKMAAKKRSRNTDYLDLEDADETITICNRLIKTRTRLWDHLQPTSALHREGSLDKLKQIVEDINALIKDAVTIAPVIQESMWDMEVGYKAIVRVAPPRPPAAKLLKKPSLNTEDI